MIDKTGITEKDIIESEQTMHLHDYQGRQMETFERLGTKPSEWKVVPIKDIKTEILGTGDKNEVIVFDFPKYDLIQPFYDNLKVENRAEFDSIRNMAGWANCQLCGHPIKNEWFIQHDAKKIYLAVGSERINNFKSAKYTLMIICRFGHRIKIKNESYLVFKGKNYCVKCVIKMIENHNSLPNDGSISGARLAQKLCEHKVKT